MKKHDFRKKNQHQSVIENNLLIYIYIYILFVLFCVFIHNFTIFSIYVFIFLSINFIKAFIYIYSES